MGNKGSTVRKSIWFAVGIVASILYSQVASADVTFSDGTFNPGDWPTIVSFGGTGGTSGAGQHTSGGNPGQFYQVTLTTNPTTATTGAGVASFFNNSAFNYNPSLQGAINSVSFSLDLISLGGNGGAAFANLALEQNGHIYAGPEYDVSSTAWQHVGSMSLAATDFGLVTLGSDGQFSLNLASNPNFSATGPSILFGFTNIGNALTNTPVTGTEIMGVDNYNLTLHTIAPVPEPAVSGLLLSGIALVVLRAFLPTKRRI